MNRQSTNEKIESIINGREDPEEDLYLQEEDRRAKLRLRKATLYGSGARARIPKTKKEAKFDMSPFAYPTPNQFPNEHTTLNSQIPPAAHTDLYRLVTNNTTKSRADPDRIFFTTTSATEGIVRAEQPPWYFGNNNKVEPPDTNLVSAASRYGFRGAKEIAQYKVEPYEPAVNTKTEYTPKFLDSGDDLIDEWVPPIKAATYSTINNLESPKLWPENTRFVTGYKNKELPQSCIYKRETTVAVDKSQRPKTSSRLEGLLRRSRNETENLRELSKMESAKTLESLPITSQTLFRASWNDRVLKNASGSLRSSMRDDLFRDDHTPATLMDSSDTLRYSDSNLVLVHTQSNEEMKFRMQMEATKSTINYAPRWRIVEYVFKSIKSKNKKDKTMDWAIMDIAARLRAEAITKGSPTTLKRSEFLPCATKIPQLEGCSQKQLSQLYSTFDQKRQDYFRFVEFLACLLVLDDPHADTAQKLLTLWRLNEEYGSDRTNLDIALNILCTCCESDEDRTKIETLFNESFKPTCYRMAILGGNNGGLMDNTNKDDSRLKKSTQSSTMRRAQSADPKKSIKRSDMVEIPQFNIGDSYLDHATFLRVLERCPMMVAAFDSMLSRRLISLYGSDPRGPAVEEIHQYS